MAHCPTHEPTTPPTWLWTLMALSETMEPDLVVPPKQPWFHSTMVQWWIIIISLIMRFERMVLQELKTFFPLKILAPLSLHCCFVRGLWTSDFVYQNSIRLGPLFRLGPEQPPETMGLLSPTESCTRSQAADVSGHQPGQTLAMTYWQPALANWTPCTHRWTGLCARASCATNSGSPWQLP